MSADALRKNWLASLAHERRASPHTLRAYGDDVARFIGFQAGHTGGAMTEKTLAKLYGRALGLRDACTLVRRAGDVKLRLRVCKSHVKNEE